MMDEITDICQGMLTTTAHKYTHIFAQGHGRIFDSYVNTEGGIMMKKKSYEKILSIFRNSKKHIKNYN